MSFLSGAFITGLLGYSLKKEALGEGFFYREVETFDWTVYVKPSDASIPFSSIQTGIKKQFLDFYSGDITVKVFQVDAGYAFPNDSVRLGRYQVQVEVRKPSINLLVSMPELTGNYYKGFDHTFIANNCQILNDFKEGFVLEQNENGHKVYSHSLSFSIRSGSNARSLAASIASGIYSKDKDTTFGIYAFIGGALVADTGNYRNYYLETYDLIRNTYSFDKKREILPIAESAYTYEIDHALNLKDDGTIEVSEKGNVNGKLSYNQAYQGMGELIVGSYGRCSDVYNKFKNLTTTVTISETLINLALVTTKTLNKPTLSAEYEVNYTNNPQYTTSGSIDKVIDINNDGKFISIDHNYNFLMFISPTYSGIDAAYISLVNDARAQSPGEIASVYSAAPFYNAAYPTVNMIKMTSATPNRHKNFSASFGYTNKPTYFVTIDSYQYAFFDYTMGNVVPVDSVTEHKIINRPSKTSLINYAYQTEKGTKNIQITAQLNRAGNVLVSPLTSATIAPRISSLYRYGLDKALSTFFGLNVFALSYSLSSVKYSLTSKNEIKMDIVIDYSVKKYTV